MLCFKREKEEGVVIQVPPSTEVRTIRFLVLDVFGNKVRVGFAAQPDIIIHREEVWLAIQEQEAAKCSDAT